MVVSKTEVLQPTLLESNASDLEYIVLEEISSIDIEVFLPKCCA